MGNKRHKYRDGQPTATFEELTYSEQAKSLNMKKLNQKKAEEAHKRRAAEEGRNK